MVGALAEDGVVEADAVDEKERAEAGEPADVGGALGGTGLLDHQAREFFEGDGERAGLAGGECVGGEDRRSERHVERRRAVAGGGDNDGREEDEIGGRGGGRGRGEEGVGGERDEERARAWAAVTVGGVGEAVVRYGHGCDY